MVSLPFPHIDLRLCQREFNLVLGYPQKIQSVLNPMKSITGHERGNAPPKPQLHLVTMGVKFGSASKRRQRDKIRIRMLLELLRSPWQY